MKYPLLYSSMNPNKPDGARLVDVSHSVEHGLVTYKGLPAPVICDYLSRDESRAVYAEGTEFQIGKIEMVANTGTYLDSPFHRYSDGKDLSQLALSSVACIEGIVIRANELVKQAIDASLFQNVEVREKAVLVHTGWDSYWGTEQYFEGHPFLTSDAARYLADAGAKLVGIDSLNIDDIRDTTRPVHSILLKSGIPIVEHLCNLSALPEEGFKFFAVPVKVKGMGTFPVRAFGMIK
jgi:kynurenine formamidase